MLSVTCLQTLVQPLQFLGGTLRVRRCVFVSWLLAAIIAIPQSIVFVQTEVHRLTPDMTRYATTYKCDSTGYTTEWQRKLYFTSVAIFLLIIPACIMIYCYANIIRVVWLRAGPGVTGLLCGRERLCLPDMLCVYTRKKVFRVRHGVCCNMHNKNKLGYSG